MKTQPLYYQNPYKTELECKALSVEQSTIFLNVILDQTIFYPEGGGQPSDRGMLGDAKVEYVRLMNGEIIHQIKGNVEKDQLIKGTLDWNWRYKYMKIHSAGHLLHDVLMTLTKKLTPIRGGYGKKAFLEYKGEMDLSLKDQIEQKVNQTAQTGIEIITKESSYS
ncbi:hypothetical protein AUK04_01235 [Candidatus Roizmanbacteria bacterium CG2_30_33_16]|uniref:Alanyl-tRNA synthetase class IIc N-terminal domain-containing protein n=2 Tax=Candidatus Roizmaniibacteriota TaxID=1752723 RepID=A0A2M7E3G3_9BACT|nr:hypothetical protein [Candidatus Roizmanbacteria bacterium]OIP85373.1 MAG: hypothetical protein AUK04_01235 [Candidatus Roizmanbacteria bacterium CG2_30_33_16]PIV62264.1 MAG: hypothetical protein COS12_03030 [Candidatus Roizmanbacteria bacterium CG01_land_8_20_14_3_00_33_9]